MVSAIDSALSGLAAAGKRLEVSANNIANQSSTKTNTNGQVTDQPYVPQQVQQVSLATGGVQTKVVPVNQPAITVPDPNSPTGTSQMPNENLEQDIVNENIASYDFKANLKTIKVNDDMLKSLLDIKS